MSSASIDGVLPTAGMSVISGVVMRPSGRTCTFDPSSGLRHTKIVSSSSGPMTYSSPGPSCIDTNCAGGNCGPLAVEQPVSTRLAIALPARRRAKRRFGMDISLLRRRFQRPAEFTLRYRAKG
jgi:hypothetical protein